MTLLKKKMFLVLIICLSWVFLFNNVALAADDYETGLILPECTETGNCSLCDILKAFANVADFMISIVGSVALLLFLYGGYVWMSSAGNQERIKRGRSVMVSTIVGILFVMGAWQIVNFTISAFVSSNPATVISFKLFNNQPWYQYCNQSLPCVNKEPGNSCGEFFVCSEQGTCITECSYQNNAENPLYYSCFPEGDCAGTGTKTLAQMCPDSGACCGY